MKYRQLTKEQFESHYIEEFAPFFSDSKYRLHIEEWNKMKAQNPALVAEDEL